MLLPLGDGVGTEIGIAVYEAVDRGRQCALGLNRAAVVGQRAGAPGGLAVGVEAAADEQVAGAVDQGAALVIQRGDADIEALAGSDGRCAAIVRAVVQGGGGKAQGVAIDTATAQVIECAGIDGGFVAIDQAAVVECLGDVEQGVDRRNLAARRIVQIGSGQGECVARLEYAAVAEQTGGE